MKKNLRKILTIMLAVILIMQASLASVSAGWGYSGKNKGRSYPGWGWTVPTPSPKEEPAPAPAEEPAIEEVEAPAEEMQEEASPVEEAEPAEEAAPEEDLLPVDEVAPVEEAPVEEADSAEEAAPSEEVAPEPSTAPAEVKYGEKTFEETAGDITVTVNAPEGALPDGTQMVLTELTADQFAAVEESVEGAVVAAIDIAFWSDGQEIEPIIPVKVTMASQEIAAVEELVEVVHIADETFEAEGIIQAPESSAEDEVVFETQDFSVYAIVASNITDGSQYVIYTGTTALAYSGNNLSTASATVNGTDVSTESDNTVWTFTQVTGGYKITYTNGNTTRYLDADNNAVDTNGSNNENGTTWVYNNTSHVLYSSWTQQGPGGGSRTRYLRLNNGSFTVTDNINNASSIYLAQVTEIVDELTYYYFNADHSGSIATAETTTDLPSSWTNVADLAKNIENYQYLEARANSVDGDVISQVNGEQYRTTAGGNTAHDLTAIYFIYMRDYIAGEDIIPDLNGPETQKTVTHNEDGTFTIKLDIIGHKNKVKHGANVVVVFDRTSSMSGNMSNTDTTMRINAAISAVNTMVTTLNPGTGADQNDIDFALVEFDRTATPYDFGSSGVTGHTYWTKSGSALYTRVNRYRNGNNLAASGATPGGGGTNWQAALQAAAAVLEDKPDADPTYVIFMTDGEPTIYIGSSSVVNNRSTTDPEYYTSVPYATAIVAADYRMYDIFCSAGSTTLLQSLYQTSGADSYVMAESQTAIENAFKAVAQAMLDEIGSSNVSSDDGVPELGSFDLDTVEGELQLSEARYYKNGAKWEDAPVATPSAGGVKWDLTSAGTLEDGMVYSIEFEVWPSQAAYDLIADLNNGIKVYEAGQANSITAEERAQIDEHIDAQGNKTYTLKTNTYLKTSYKLYGSTHTDDIDFTPDAMDLPTETVSVVKLWPENMLDDYGAAIYRDENDEEKTATEINLTLMRGTEEYFDFTVKASEGWRKDDVYISNGFMTVEEVDGEKVVHVKETGHDYQIIEPEGFSYYWDLVSDVYHPMVINGEPEMLILNTEKTSADVDNETFFELEGKIYELKDAADNTLEASNYRRSNLNFTKKVEGAATDELFTYTATVNDSNSNDGYVWFSAWDPVAGDLVYDLDVTGGNAAKETKDIPEVDGNKVLAVSYSEDGKTVTITTKDKDGNPEDNTYPLVNEGTTGGKYYTGYFFATNGATLTIKIKAGWNVRYLNVYHGTTFSFNETGMPEKFEFDKVEASTQYTIMKDSNKDWYEIDENSTSGLITGTITEPNNNYNVTYTNKHKPEFYMYHSGVANDGNLETINMRDKTDSSWNSDGTFNLYKKTTNGTLYGGYYLDYEGKGDYEDKGVPGTTGVVYTGMNYQNWAGCEAQTVDGTKMEPVAGETYYIKEVPTYYLRNYHQINYVKSDGKLMALYLISAVDDLKYNETGLTLQTDDGKVSNVCTSMQFKNTATGKYVTLKANTVFKSIGITGDGSDKEYLTYWDATSSDYFAVGKFTVKPYWITPDGITVHGISTRTITITEMTKSGISKEDK